MGKIIAFHVVYQSYQKEIMYFTQMLVYFPGILVILDKTIGTMNLPVSYNKIIVALNIFARFREI